MRAPDPLRGDPAPVDVAALEKELGRLWKEQAAGREESPVTRACLLNLVVVDCMATPSPTLAQELSAVFRARPCRILKLELDGGQDGDEVQAWISAHCIRPTREEKQVCCEQITLRAGSGGATHLPSLVRALTVSDLPVFLYLPDGLPSDTSLLEDLASASDRIIVDSAELSLAELTRLSRRGPLADLGWGRLLGLRASVAEIFDSPLLEPLLERIREVRTAGGPGTETEASLLHGWVRAVLEERDLTSSHAIDPSAPRGRVTLLALEAGNDTRIAAQREEGSDLILARAEMPGTCPLPRRRRDPERSTAALLCDEVDRPGADAVFLEALAARGEAG